MQIHAKSNELETARGKLRVLERDQRDALAANTDSEQVEKLSRTITGLEASKKQTERDREHCEGKWKKLLSFKGVCPMCGSDSKELQKGAEKLRGEELGGFVQRLAGLSEQITTNRGLSITCEKERKRRRAVCWRNSRRTSKRQS